MSMEETLTMLGIDRRPAFWDERYMAGVENMSRPEYGVVFEEDVFLTARDGVRLAVDIYRPDAPPGETFPGLVAWSSYGKGVQTLERAPLQFKTVLMDHTIEAGDIEFYVRRGYAVCIPDARGVGKSQGQWDGLYGAQEQQDCYDVIEWLATQPWCTGNIGMIGISYFSIIQPLVAALRPPHLKAIMMCEVLDSLYHHNYIGGAFFDRSFLYNHFIPAKNQMSWSERHYTEAELRQRVEERRNDWDVKSSALLTRVMQSWPPRHQSYFFDVILHNYDDEFWAERGILGKEQEIDIPMYLISEYYDRGRFTQGPFHLYNHCRQDLPRKVFAPESHDDLFLPHRTLSEETVRWYDHWLKGKDTGLMAEPPIKLKVEGDGRFRYEHEWPLRRTDWKKLYLRENGGMDFAPGADPTPDTLVHVPPLEEPYYPRQTPELRWCTPPLEQDLEVTGPLTLYLSCTLSAPDANLVALLNEVLPDGSRRYITSGALRASHRLTGFADDLPWQPRHDHTKSVPVTPGEIQEYVLEIMTICRVFRQGHGIELVLKNFSPSEFNFITFIPDPERVQYDVFHGGPAQSWLLLPVIPDSPEENWVR